MMQEVNNPHLTNAYIFMEGSSHALHHPWIACPELLPSLQLMYTTMYIILTQLHGFHSLEDVALLLDAAMCVFYL